MKDKDISKDDIDSFADWIADEAGFFGARIDYKEMWMRPIAFYLEKGRGDAGAKDLVKQALAFARGDNASGTRYKIKNPASLSKIVANLNGSGPEKVTQTEGGGMYV